MAQTPWHRGGRTRIQSCEPQGSEDTQERGRRDPRTWHTDSAYSTLVLRMSQGVWALSGRLGEAEI